MSDEPAAAPAVPKETYRKAECSNCGGLRNCEIQGRHDVHDDDGQVWGNTTWYILECRGCEHVFVQTATTFSEEWDYTGNDGDIEYNVTLEHWPALSKRKRPDWLGDYGMEAENAKALSRALREVYGALDNDLPMLAGIGIRTSLDIAAELLQVDPTLPFAKKLDALVDAKHIRTMDRERLEVAVEVGNASAHRGWIPEAADLDTMMNVLEEFIFETFVRPYRRKKLDEQAAKVKETVPLRVRKKKSFSEGLPPGPMDETPSL